MKISRGRLALVGATLSVGMFARDYLDSRSFVLRNQRRTTLMLGLVRLHLNGTDNPRRYAELLRSWLTDNAGNAPAQRTGYDRGTSRRLPAHQRVAGSLRT